MQILNKINSTCMDQVIKHNISIDEQGKIEILDPKTIRAISNDSRLNKIDENLVNFNCNGNTSCG